MTQSPSKGHIVLRWALLAMAIAIGGVIATVLGNPIDAGPVASTVERPSAETGSGQPPAALAPLPPVEMLTETRTRPLFSPDRKPVAAGTIVAQEAASGESDIELLGTLVSGNREQALLRVKQPASQEWLAVGAVAAGWRVIKITKDRVVIVAAGKRRELVLYPPATPKKN